MKKILLGFALAIALFGAFYLGRLAQHNQRLTEASAAYLFEDTSYKDSNGKALRRVDLLDMIIREAAKGKQ